MQRGCRFWFLEGSAGTAGSGRWVLRAQDEKWEQNIVARLRRGRKLSKKEWPSSPPRFDRVEGAPRADIRWMFGPDVFVVSQRFREVVERAAPGAAQFLPVQVGRARRGASGRYWAINWLRVFDCQPDAELAEIDPALVPADDVLGVVAGDRWWCAGEVIVRADVKRVIERAKLRGVRFSPVRERGSPGDLLRRRNAGTGKLAWVERRLIPAERCFDVDAYLASGRGPNDRTAVPGCTAFLEYVTMHSAMGTLNDRVVIRMLGAGGNPNVVAAANLSPLLVVMNPKRARVLRALNRAGADWNLANSVGVTPLMSAAMDGDVAAVREMMKYGADARWKDRNGMTAVDHARGAMKGAGRAERKRLGDVIRAVMDKA